MTGMIGGMRVDLSEKVALVTGGSRGLGAGFAKALAEAGAAVAVAARHQDAASAIARQLVSNKGVARAYAVDVRSRDQVCDMVAAVSAELGPIDILINSAGVSYHAPAADVAPTEWLDTFEVNLHGLWWCTQAVASRMIEDGHRGSIINIGSISGLIVNRPFMQPAYNASKAAVHHLTRSLAAEWAPYGIRVNAVAPGFVRTEMTEAAEAEFAGQADFRRYTVEDVPMRRYARIEEIVPVVLYLASGECSSYVTGSIIVIDGGYTLW